MDGFKQRLIGAVVLVFLAVIFIPMLFEEPHQEKTTEVLQIPAQPEVPAFTIESPRPPERTPAGQDQLPSLAAPKLTEDISVNSDTRMTGAEMQIAKPASDEVSESSGGDNEISWEVEDIGGEIPASQDNQAATTEAAEVAITQAQQSVAKGVWVVQIGTFKNRPGALKIRDELRKSGTPAYTTDIVSGDIPMVRVFAGPTDSKEAASELKEKVDKRYNLQSMVTTYKEP